MAIDFNSIPIRLGGNAQNHVLTVHIQDSSRLLRTDSLLQSSINVLCGGVSEEVIACLEIAPSDFSRIMAHSCDNPILKNRILALLGGKDFPSK
ncbi:MAG: hypothetical protein WC753_02485 [Candidatus Gracilibacteria bacterium]